MKDILVTLLGALLTFTLASPCSVAPASPDSGRSLILFYSLSGNTRLAAEALSRLTGAPLAEIKTVEPYPDDFHAVVEQARQERSTGYRPPILPLSVDLDDYDTVYLGFPIWSNSIPQPMASFLSEHHLEGKTILPFCTHDGYGPGRSFRVVGEYCPDARVLPGFDMLGSETRDAEAKLKAWLIEVNVALSDAASSSSEASALVIRMNGVELRGELNDSSAAREFLRRLPVTVSMTGYGGREYYGDLGELLNATEEGRLRFDDGDITYCPQNNTVAIFYAQTSCPDLSMRVIPMGRVTSPLDPLSRMPRRVTATFSLNSALSGD